jgi:hypothetical protein
VTGWLSLNVRQPHRGMRSNKKRRISL